MAVVEETAKCLSARPLVAVPPKRVGCTIRHGKRSHLEAAVKFASITRAWGLGPNSPSPPRALFVRGQLPNAIS